MFVYLISKSTIINNFEFALNSNQKDYTSAIKLTSKVTSKKCSNLMLQFQSSSFIALVLFWMFSSSFRVQCFKSFISLFEQHKF